MEATALLKTVEGMTKERRAGSPLLDVTALFQRSIVARL